MNGGASSTIKEAPAYPFGIYTTPRLSPESARTRHARKMPLLDFLYGIVGEKSQPARANPLEADPQAVCADLLEIESRLRSTRSI